MKEYTMLPAIQAQSTCYTKQRQAVLFLLGSLFLYTIQDALIKSLPFKYSVFEIIFFRCLFSLIPVFLLGFIEQGHFKSPLPLLKTQHLKAQLLRAFLMFLSLICYFMACRQLPLASLYTLSYTSPLFMTLLAIPLLGERVGIYRSLAVIFGFIGVFIVLKPTSDIFQLDGLYAVASGFFTGASVILGKRLCVKDSNTLLVFMYLIVSIAGVLFILPFVWVTPNLDDLFVLAIAGFVGGVAQFGFIHAFRIVPVSYLAPFDYCGLLIATGVGFIIWYEIPSSSVLLGAFFIVSTGLVIFYREKQPPPIEG